MWDRISHFVITMQLSSKPAYCMHSSGRSFGYCKHDTEWKSLIYNVLMGKHFILASYMFNEGQPEVNYKYKNVLELTFYYMLYAVKVNL